MRLGQQSEQVWQRLWGVMHTGSHLESLALRLSVRSDLWAPERGRELWGLGREAAASSRWENGVPWDRLFSTCFLGQIEVLVLSSSCCPRCELS